MKRFSVGQILPNSHLNDFCECVSQMIRGLFSRLSLQLTYPLTEFIQTCRLTRTLGRKHNHILISRTITSEDMLRKLKKHATLSQHWCIPARLSVLTRNVQNIDRPWILSVFLRRKENITKWVLCPADFALYLTPYWPFTSTSHIEPLCVSLSIIADQEVLISPASLTSSFTAAPQQPPQRVPQPQQPQLRPPPLQTTQLPRQSQSADRIPAQQQQQQQQPQPQQQFVQQQVPLQQLQQLQQLAQPLSGNTPRPVMGGNFSPQQPFLTSRPTVPGQNFQLQTSPPFRPSPNFSPAR